MFTRLEFQDFRGFAHLDLQGLQRVNLICGQNNCGKTSLLEGIEALCDPGRLVAKADLSSLRPDPKSPIERRSRWLRRDSASGAASVVGFESAGANRSLYLATEPAQFPAGINPTGAAGSVLIGLGRNHVPVTCKLIDHIFVNAGVHVQAHAVVAQHENGRVASDHFPVVALIDVPSPRPTKRCGGK